MAKLALVKAISPASLNAKLQPLQFGFSFLKINLGFCMVRRMMSDNGFQVEGPNTGNDLYFPALVHTAPR